MVNNMYGEEELKHYGVPGMRWGVRRNANVLYNHRRNRAVKRARDQYAVGSITKERKKAMIKSANDYKKKSMKQTMAKAASVDKVGYAKLKREVVKQTVTEVPNQRIKKGAHVVNNVLHGYALGTTLASSLAAAAVMGPAGVVPGGIGAAVIIGRQQLIRMGINKLS